MSKADRKELARQAAAVRTLLDGLLARAEKGERAETEMAVAGLGAATSLLLSIGTDLNRIADALERLQPPPADSGEG